MSISMTWPQSMRGECTISGFTIKLTDFETEALMLLMLRCPNPVTTTEMIEWLWHDARFEPSYTEGMLYHVMRRLRAKVGEFRIPARVNFGYRLAQHPEPKRGRGRGKRGPA